MLFLVRAVEFIQIRDAGPDLGKVFHVRFQKQGTNTGTTAGGQLGRPEP